MPQLLGKFAIFRLYFVDTPEEERVYADTNGGLARDSLCPCGKIGVRAYYRHPFLDSHQLH